MSGNEQRARQLAEGFRTEHRLDDMPIKDMFELVHATMGIDVLSMAADEAEHGLSMTDPSTGTVVIAVSTTAHPMRQRTSIAHELGHVLAGDLEREQSFTPGRRSPAEICADAFARHLLLPLSAVRRRFHGRDQALTVADLSRLVQEFAVSPHVAAIQLRDLHLIDQGAGAAWSALSSRNLAARFGWLSQYRSLAADSTQARAPQNLMARAVAGYRAGVLSIIEVASWYGQRADELEQQLSPDVAVDNPTSDDETDDWDRYWDASQSLFPDSTAGPAS